MSVRGPAHTRRTGARRPRRRAGAALRRGAGAARARARDGRRDGRRGHGRLRRHDGLRRSLLGAHRRRRRRPAAAQPRALARHRRRRAAARTRSCAACCCCSPTASPRATRACGPSSSRCCSACSSATCCPSSRAAARSAPRAISRRSRTSRSCSAARARRRSSGERLDGGEALRRAGLAPVELAAKEGLALINGTHLMAACGALALRDARRLLDAAVVTSALSLEAFMGSTTPFDARIHDLRRHPGQGAVAARLRAPARGQRDRREPRRLRARAGSVHAALRAAGARRDRRRARLRRGRARARARLRDRQPAALPRRRRGLLGRQLPRPAALARARPPRARAVRAGLVRRAPHLRAALAELRRAAALPHAPPRPLVGPDDRPVHAGRARQRVPGARASRRRRLGADLGRHGGLQLDGRVGRAQGAPDRRLRRARRRDRARVRVPGDRVPPAAAEHARRSRPRSPRCARASRGWSRTARSRPRSSRSPTRCAAASSCSRRSRRHAGPGCSAAAAGSRPSSARRPASCCARTTHGLLLDAGTGLRRLVSEPELLDGVRTLDIVLTHFHLDHVCGLAYVPALPRHADDLGSRALALRAGERRPPRAAAHGADLAVGGRASSARCASSGRAPRRSVASSVTTRAQPLHWAPTAGHPRRATTLALITDTAYDPESADVRPRRDAPAARGLVELGEPGRAGGRLHRGRGRTGRAARRARGTSRSSTSIRGSPAEADAPRGRPRGTTRARGSGAIASRSSSLERVPRPRDDGPSGVELPGASVTVDSRA